MNPSRSILFGCLAALLALIVSAVLPFTVARQNVGDSSAQSLKPGTVISREELDARTRQAEANLATARARIQENGVTSELLSRVSNYFALFAPFMVFGAALIITQPHRKELLLLPLPVVVAMLLLGPKAHGLALLVAATLVPLFLRTNAFAAHAGDA